jgi:osmoprotectant transport system ATP-binding protein
MIRLEDLRRTYASPQGTVIAVDGVSFEVREGETCVLLGPSGCGKTTTLRMINRLVAPTSGKIFIAAAIPHRRPGGASPRHRLRDPADRALSQHDGRGEHRRRAAPFLMAGRTPSRARRGVLSMLALPPGQFADRYPNELSGGQAQRVGVARALAVDPRCS